MSSKLNVETFIAVLKKSGLVEAERLQRLITDYTAKGGVADDSPKLADFLVANGVITRWQAEKLLQGKHKGYFLGKYRLLSLLGKGGMSSVYLAEHVLMRRRCALKVLPTKRVHDSSYLARFHREAQAVASLDHPNIVRAYDVDHQVDRDSEIHFLVMEYVEGFSLQELVQKLGMCSFLDSAEYIRQAALGLHHAHEAGMVHRDVKPGNLLVDPNGVVKVLDLGLARFFTGDEDEDALTLRHDEKVLGTADYLAPEQALDSHTVDERADIYALGCTMYFLLTGRPPFTEGTLAQRLMAHQTKTPPTVESLRADTPPSLAAIVRRMMAKKPEDRYQTARDASDAVYAWIDLHADSDWRKAHSGIYGTRSAVEAANIPIARPVVAMPVAAPVFTPTAPVTPPQASAAPAGFQFAPPVQAAAPAVSPPAESALSDFFASLSDSQTGSIKPGAKPVPAVPKPVPAQSTIVSASAPPHLKPPSSLKLKNTDPVLASTDSPFLDFGGAAGAPAAPVKPAAAAPKAPKPAKQAKSKFKLPFELPSKLPFKWPLPTPVLAGIGGGVVVLLLIVVYFMGWMGGGGGPGGGNVEVPQTPWPAEKREVTVGAEGAEYKTINAALLAVRRRYEPTGAANDVMVIKVAAGTYPESILVDGTVHRARGRNKKPEKPVDPDWPAGIKLVADGEVILEAPTPKPDQPGSDGPLLRLKNIPKFVVDGITINATGKAIGVEIAGDMNESRLSGVKIKGFTQVGVTCLGARGISFGNSQFVLERLTLEPAVSSKSAIGVRMQSGGDGDPSDTVVRGCRFLGPLAAGVTISGAGPYRITISENIFHKTQDGIRCEGAVQWKDILILNNTFQEGRHGIVFTNMPAEGSMGLGFRRNLFTKMTAAEGVVEAGYNAPRLSTMLTLDRPGWELNYSDRAKPGSPQAGEIDPLLDTNGKRGEANFAFSTTDVKSPKFLAPTDKSVQRSVPGAAEGEKDWVGAVGP
ncbi:MAG: Serine/threonine protein kinaserelated protein [Schlesneria sp.]|nr:Serine/threonine protein kinaserelated protein [Schlesneria sp.]